MASAVATPALPAGSTVLVRLHVLAVVDAVDHHRARHLPQPADQQRRDARREQVGRGRRGAAVERVAARRRRLEVVIGGEQRRQPAGVRFMSSASITDRWPRLRATRSRESWFRSTLRFAATAL